MPKYEYKCPSCGRFTVHQEFTDESLKACPTCDAPVHKVFSTAGFVVRGQALMADADKWAPWDRKHPVKREP